MNCIILADGYPKGMKSKGPVGLLKINNKYNLFQHQYALIRKKFKNSKIVYVYGHEGKRIEGLLNDKKKYKNVIKIYNQDYEKYNQTYSLNLASNFMDQNLLIIGGNSVCNKEIFDCLQEPQKTKVFVNKKIKNEIGCNINQDQIVTNICFSLENYLMNIYYVSKENVLMLKEIVGDDTNKNCFTFEIFNKMINYGIDISPVIKNKKNIYYELNKDTVV